MQEFIHFMQASFLWIFGQKIFTYLLANENLRSTDAKCDNCKAFFSFYAAYLYLLVFWIWHVYMFIEMKGEKTKSELKWTYAFYPSSHVLSSIAWNRDKHSFFLLNFESLTEAKAMHSKVIKFLCSYTFYLVLTISL